MSDATPARSKLLTDVQLLAYGTHIGLIHGDLRELREAIIPFIVTGLARGDRCIYIGDDRSASSLLEEMHQRDVDVDEALASGRLLVAADLDAFRWDDRLDPDTAIGYIARATQAALTAGYGGARIAMEMGWLAGGADAELLPELVGKLGRFLNGSKAIAMCHYHAGVFPAEELLAGAQAHPFIIHRGMLCRNFHYVPPERMPGPPSAGVLLDRFLDGIARVRQAEEAGLEADDFHSSLIHDENITALMVAPMTGDIVAVSPAACALYGRTEEELLRISLVELSLLPREQVFEHLAQAATGTRRRWFDRQLGPEGVELDVEIYLGPTRYHGQDALYAIIHDLSDQARVEEELRAVQARYRALFSAMLNAFALYEVEADAEGHAVDCRFLDVNPAFERATGLTREDVVGRSLLEVTPDLGPHWIEAFGHVAATGDPFQFESYSQPMDRHFEVYAFRPEPGQCACLFSDISEQRRTDEALRASEREYRDIVQSASSVILRWDTEGVATFINDYGLMLFGCSRDEFLGRPLSETISSRNKDAEAHLRAEIDGIRQRPERFASHEGRHNRRDGSPLAIRWTNTAIYDETGSMSEILSVGQNVTEASAAEEALRESEEKYRTIFELSPEAIVLLDAEGIVVDVNGRIEEWLGYPRDEVVDRSIVEAPFMPRGSAAVAREHLVERLGGTNVAPYRLEFCHRGGETRVGRVTGTAIRSRSGQVAGAIIMATDLTAIEDLESRVAATDGADDDQAAEAEDGPPAPPPAAPDGATDVNEALRGLAGRLDRIMPRPAIVRRSLADGALPTVIEPELVERVALSLATRAAGALGGQAGTVSLRTEWLDAAAAADYARVERGRMPAASYVLLEVCDTGRAPDSTALASLLFGAPDAPPEEGSVAAVRRDLRERGGEVLARVEPGRGTIVAALLPG
jgi:PAS domain S-box-containing protein